MSRIRQNTHQRKIGLMLRAFCTLLAALAVGQIADAQLTRGYISGTVTDSSNAVISGAQVIIKNEATNITRDTLTNEVGLFRFAAIEPGVYSIEFRIVGFENRRIDTVTVRTAQEVVLNQQLPVSGVATEITVTGVPGVDLEKSRPTIQQTFSERVISELPLPMYQGAREISRLAWLAPTAIRAPGSNEFAVNGQRPRNNNFTIDGVDNNDLSVTTSATRVIPEAVREVQVQVMSYSAEFGRTSGAQVSAITKNGTNTYHGEVWDHYRGNWMEPLSLTNKRARIQETPRFVMNDFGGDAGGPIVKNRTFFFGLLEGNRRRGAPDTRVLSSLTPPNIPTPAGYAALLNAPLRPGQSPASRQAVLSALSFLPEIHSLVSNYDNVTVRSVNNIPIQVGTIRIPVIQPSNFWYSAARIDHQLTGSDSLSYRYHMDKREQPNTQSNLTFGDRWAGATQVLRQNHAISHTHTFSGRLLNEARLSYVRSNLNFPENDPKASTVNITGFFTTGGLSGFPQGRIDQLYQLQDVVTYVAGRNSFKVGFDVRMNKIYARFGANSKGTWTFSSLEDFLNNNALSLVQAVNEATFDAKQWNHSYFFQDDIKATKDLTLNLGTRYEYSTVPFGFFGATDPAVRAAGVTGPVLPDKNNWAPRVGFAYSPSAPTGLLAGLLGPGRTSIRGGFGMAYDILFYNLVFTPANTNYPRILTQTTNQAVDLFPTLAPKTATVGPLNARSTFINIPENTQNPTTNFWNLSVQRDLGSTYVLELGYTGNRSYHQIRQSDGNPGVLTPQMAADVIQQGSSANVTPLRRNPDWGARSVLEATAKSEYHAGYIKFDKRLSQGLQVGANFTWSANFSDNDEAFGANDVVTSSPQVPQDFSNYRQEWSRSAFDRPHRFVIHYVYEIPWFGSVPALKPLFGGWQVAGITEYQSGQPFTIRTGVDTVGSLSTAFPGRPNYNAGGILTKDPDTGDLRTFRIPTTGNGIVVTPLAPNGTILANSMPGGGNLGRNTFRGPSFQNWNLSLMKKIAINETWQLQVRSDFVNLWNHNNFQNPEARMSNAAFGANTANLLTDVREIMFSAKLRF